MQEDLSGSLRFCKRLWLSTKSLYLNLYIDPSGDEV